MIYYGWRMAALQVATHQKTIIMRIPLVYLYAILPAMGIMMFIRTIQVIIWTCRKFEHKVPKLPSTDAETGLNRSLSIFGENRSMELSDIVIMLHSAGMHGRLCPVFMCLFFTAVLGFILFTDLPVLLLAQSLFRSMDNFALVVVLYFILCGNIMTAGTIVEKLIKMANALVSWLPGGLGMAGVSACGLFGAISGSTVATVVALGGFMIPALHRKRISREIHPRPHDHVAQPRGHHPPQHRHDSLLHDQQCLPGRAVSDGIYTRCPDHCSDLCIHLFLLPQRTDTRPHAHSETSKNFWLFSRKASGP